MKNLSKHAEWLSLIEISGPFLTVSMLDKAFPQGLETVETPRRQKLRAAYEEWREAVDQEDRLLPELHREWVRLVLTEMLEYDQESLVHVGDWPDEILSVSSQEHAGTFNPDWIVRSPADGKPRLFIAVLPPDTDLESVQRGDGWPVSLQERMTLLCRAHGVRVGLLTDGERWMLVNAPVGSTSSQASWYARLWFQEPITLKAFQSLLGVRRCFGPAEDTLESLLDESLKHHEEVTDTLGEQVRRAVEVLVQCLDKADEDRNRELLRDVKPAELYEAGLTVMMRLVFVLCAEERGLLLLGDSVYDRCYAVSTLRGQLAEEADRHGPEVLDRRHDAWARLLAVFRAVYGGIEHESLRMPALGGSLFDPDRFPFLEGRAKGTGWRDTSAAPLPIDNRTVLLLLNSLQILEQSGGALLLSYRALDVEQIGHVYEGLLEHTVARVPRVTLGLQGSPKAKNPNVALAELESARLDGEAALVKLVLEVTGRSESAIKNGLSKPADDTIFGRVLGVCGGDTALAKRIRPFTNLIRTDAWDDPIVYRDNSFMVTLGADRRETGTHYTPKSLTESIVTTTLEPVVYVGPAEGKPREEWALKLSRVILDLKVCDPAMGSGAFLVQACRYLGEKLVEAWLHEEAAGKAITVDGEALDQLGAEEPLPSQLDERLTIARRLVAERCLYGVDINPLAVELAKLSIWLVTLAKGRPFGFLDHNLRSGDSLLGIHRLEQLTRLRMDTESGRQYQLRIFGQNIEAAVNEAIELRKRLRATTIRDIKDVEAMARLDREARRKLESVELIADAMIGEALRCGGNSRALDTALDTLSTMAGDFLNGNEEMGDQIARQVRKALAVDLPEEKPVRKLFHWALEFPEVFCHSVGGFDATISNPPFAEGEVITESTKAYFLTHYKIASGTSDESPSKHTKLNLGTLFIERNITLLKMISCFGIVVPKPFLRNERYWRTRQYLMSITCLSHIFDLPASSFRSASVETCSLIGLGRQWSIASRPIKVVDLATNAIATELISGQVLADSRFVFRISSSGVEIGLMDVIQNNRSKLDDYFEIKDGINPGRKDFRPFLLGRVKDGYFVPNAHESSPLHPLSKPEKYNPYIHRPTINGRNFEEFSAISWDGTFLRYTSEVAYLEEFFVKGTRWSAQLREREHYDREIKIVSRQTAKTLIATIDSERYFPLNTVHSHFPKHCANKAGYDSYVLLGILNSNVLRFYYQTLSQETGKVFPQVHISKIKALPIPTIINNEMRSKIAFIVKDVLSGIASEKLYTLNQTVYELYGLDESQRRTIDASLSSDASDFVDSEYMEAATTCSAPGTLYQSIESFFASNDGWYSKNEVLQRTSISANDWQSTIAQLLADGLVERQGERRGAKYRAVKRNR